MPVSSSTEHWIKPDALTINLNHFGDPDYLQVSVLAGAVVMAFKQDVIGYNAAHNYRTWPLEAANTYLETTSAVNVYAKLTRSEVNARALIVYDTVLRDIEGREITYAEDGSEVLGDASTDYFFVFLGQISESVDSNGQSVHREWSIDFRFGVLDTTETINEDIFFWQKLFIPHYDDPKDPTKLSWIEAKSHMGIQGGVTMFIEGEGMDLPSIYDGLPIDNDTIYWEEIKDEEGNVIGKRIKARGGSGEGGITPTLLGDLTNVGSWANSIATEDRIMVQRKDSSSWVALNLSEIGGGSADFSNVLSSGEGNAFTSFVLSEDKKTLTLVKGKTFAEKSASLSGYGITDAYTKTEVDGLIEDYLPLEGGTIQGDVRLRTGNEYTSPYLYFGDGSEVYLVEETDRYLTIHADRDILLTTGSNYTAKLNGNSIATETWVTNKGYATASDLDSRINALVNGAPAAYDTLKEIADVLQGNVNSIGDIVTALGGKADKATTLAGYGITDAKISNGVITLGGNTITPLTSHQTIYNLTLQAGTFSATTFDPNGGAKTVNIPTTTSHISEGSNLYFTNARAVSALSDTLSLYVTKAGTQTITGEKDFTGGLKVNGSQIVYDKTNKYWKLTGDLVVTGGITMFANDGSYTPSTITDAVNIDNQTIIRQNGKLMVNPELLLGGGEGGEVSTVAWGNIIGKPSWITDTKPKYSYTEISGTPDLSVYATKGATLAHYGIADAKISNGTITLGNNTITPLTQSLGDGRYLKLSGGTISGGITYNGDIQGAYVYNFIYNVTTGWARDALSIKVDGNARFSLGAYGSYTHGAEDNSINYAYLGCHGWDGLNLRISPTHLKWGDYEVLHGLNYNTYVPSLTGTGATGTWNIAIKGNAATATALKTPRSIWGNSFDGSKDISGNISLMVSKIFWHGDDNNYYISCPADSGGAGLEYKADSSHRFISGGSEIFTILASGKIGVKNNNPQYNFDVNGSTRIQGTSVVRNVIPEGGDSYTLGSSSYLWSNLYTKKATVDGIEIKKSADGVLYIDGNLVVSGGVTMYGTDGTTSTTIWDNAPIASTSDKGIASFDSNYFAVNNGKVTFIGSTGGGVADSVAWTNVTGKPNSISGYGITDAYTKTESDGRYIKVGGSLSSNINFDNYYTPACYNNQTGNGSGNTNAPSTYGLMFVFGGDGLAAQMHLNAGNSELKTRTRYVRSGVTSWTDWKTLAYQDGNIATATKLKTPRSIWGNNFDGSADIKNSNLILYKNESSYTGGWAREVESINSSGKVIGAFGLYGSGDTFGRAFIGESYENMWLSVTPTYTHVYGKLETSQNVEVGTTLSINGITLKKSASGVLYVDGNLVVKGGVTMYGSDSTSAPSILDSLPIASTIKKGIAQFNGSDFVVSNGVVSLNGNLGLDESALASYLSTKKYLTQTSGDARYLKLTGGKITNPLTVEAGTDTKIILNNTDGEKCQAISFREGGTEYSYILASSGGFSINHNGNGFSFNGNTIWHKGNQGSGSGLDADKLDGQEGSYYASAASLANYLPLTGGTITGNWLNIGAKDNYKGAYFRIVNNTSSGADYGTYIRHYNDGQYQALDILNDGLYYSNNGTQYNIIHSNNIGNYNAGTATSLKTARTLWGNSFDGSKNVSGNIALMTSKIFWHGDENNYCISCPTTSSGAELVYKAYSSHRFISGGSEIFTILTSGKIGVKNNNPQYNFDVNGSTRIQGTSVVRNVIPEGGNSYNLGSSSNLWANLYAKIIEVDGVSIYKTTETNLLPDAHLRVNSKLRSNEGFVSDAFSFLGNKNKRLSNIGWYRFAKRNVYTNNSSSTSSGNCTLYIKKGYANYDAESFEIHVTWGYSTVNLVQVSGLKTSSSITKVRATFDYGGQMYFDFYVARQSNEFYCVNAFGDCELTDITSATSTLTVTEELELSEGMKVKAKNSEVISVATRTAGSGCYINHLPNNQSSVSWLAGSGADYKYGLLYKNGSASTLKMSLDSSGNLLTTGGITMYSDERKKTILNHVELSLKEVADAPLIEHYYNSDEAKTTHVGSVAQYWAGLNDWFCKEDGEGFLTMEIQNAALASAISVARELTRYESKTDKQIKKLKKRIGELEEEIENLKNK